MHAPSRFSLNSLPKTVGVPLSRVHSHVSRVPGSGPICIFYTMKLENCLTCHVLIRRKCSGIHGLSNKLGVCGTTATPVVEGRKNSAPTDEGRDTAPISVRRRPTIPSHAIRMSTYNVRYPNPVLGVGGAVSALMPNRHMRVASASPNFTHSTTT